MENTLKNKGFVIKKYMSNLSDTQKDILAFAIIMIASLIVRSFYVDFISIYDMQHDVGTPHRSYGHLGYISYLYKFGHLPDFKVTDAYQFWHPPLHHAVSAIFMSLMWKVFPSQNGNYEVLQALPLLYITICIWVIWETLKILGFKGKSLFFPTAIIAFNPTFIFLSGSVNNDALCVLFTLLSVYLAIRWYQKPTFPLIIASAISVGLGMSSKGTTAVAAFPMAFLFLIGLIKYKQKVIGQLFVFGFTSLPLGLWWYIRNYILYDIPINYIYHTDINSIGYLGNVPIWQRVLDFDPRRLSFDNLYVQFDGHFMEINPITALIKSTLYGQAHFNYSNTVRFFAYPLLFIWIALVIMALLAIPGYIKNHKGQLIERISILILFVVQFISYYTFCIEFPFVWTMDIRYAVPLLGCVCVFLANFIDKKSKWTFIANILSVLFVVITVIVFYLFSFTTFPSYL